MRGKAGRGPQGPWSAAGPRQGTQLLGWRRGQWCGPGRHSSGSAGGGRGGHAVRGYKPARRGQKYGIWHRNSWTARWGLGGDAVFPEAWYVQGGIGGWWAVRSVVDEGGDVPAPKVS